MTWIQSTFRAELIVGRSLGSSTRMIRARLIPFQVLWCPGVNYSACPTQVTSPHSTSGHHAVGAELARH